MQVILSKSAKDGNWYVWLRRHSSRKSIMPWACCMQQPSWSNEPQHYEHRYVENHPEIMDVYLFFVCLIGGWWLIHMALKTLVKKNDHALGLLHATTILQQWATAHLLDMSKIILKSCIIFVVCLILGSGHIQSAKDGNWYVWLCQHSSRKAIMPWVWWMQQPSCSNVTAPRPWICKKIYWNKFWHKSSEKYKAWSDEQKATWQV